MNDSHQEPQLDLAPFAKRIRMVYAWQGVGWGLCAGGVVAALGVVLDRMRVLEMEPLSLAITLAGGAILGAVIGASRRISSEAIARSIDRRAGLEDRLVTAQASAEGAIAGQFGDAVVADADQRVRLLDPRRLYPARFGRAHSSGIVTAVAASALFLAGNAGLLVSPSERAAREAMAEKAKTVERLRKENLDEPEENQDDPELKTLSKELEKLQKDLEKSRLSKEEMLQKANEIMKKANELKNAQAENVEKEIAKAHSALEQWQKKELDKQLGNNALSPEQMQNASLSEMERQAMKDELKAEIREAEQKANLLNMALSELNKKLQNRNLTDEQRKALERQKEQLGKALSEQMKKAESAKEALKGLELTPEQRAVLDKLLNDPMMQEIRELASKLQREASQAKNGNRPELTQEQLDEMKKKIEQFLKAMEDDDARKEYLKKLLEAIKNAKKLGNCNGICMLPGLGILPGLPAPGPDNDKMLVDTGRVNKLNKPVETKGKGQAEFVATQRDDARSGQEAYIEIKAPTTVGTMSSVPYRQVLPKYKEKAESAVRKSQIPKEHQARVKKYFDSLGK
jgi:hypothetical protein